MKERIGMRTNVIKGFLKKEFAQMVRDVRMRVVLFAAPVFMLLLFGYAVTTDVKNVEMAVLDEDKSAQSRALIERFTASGYFQPSVYLFSEKELVPLMDRGKVEVYIHIGRGFAERVKSGKATAIQLIVDGTDSTRASVIVSYVNIITSGFSFEFFQNRIRLLILAKGVDPSQALRIQRQNIELKERILFNPDLSSRNFFLPAILGLLITMITITLTSMSIVKERETGTIEQLIVSPLKPSEIIAGKTIPFALVSFFDTVVITVIMVFWFKVPFQGGILFLLISSLLFIFCSISVGLYISTISRTQQQALLSVVLFFLPSILFSGFMFPIYAMPLSMQIITLFNPIRYYVEIIRGIFLKGVGIEVLWSQVLALALLGAALFYLSAKRFAKRIE
jgi:ABC-2 type transport system permease protein